MSEERNEQLHLVRQSLAEKVFAPYHQLATLLRTLPIQQELPLFQKALLDIDTGMLIVKEIIMTGHIIIPLTKPTENIAVGEPYPIEESKL